MFRVSGVTVFVSFFAVLRVSDVTVSVGSFVASLAPPVAITGIKGAAKTDTMPHKDETVPG